MLGGWAPLSRSVCHSQATPVLASYDWGLGASLQVGVPLTSHTSPRILCSGVGRLSPGRRAAHKPCQSSHLMLGGWAPLSRSACHSQATPVLASYARGLGTSLQVGMPLTGHASPSILCSGAGHLSPGRCAAHRPRQPSHLMQETKLASCI
jgi:hypothetical protein